VPADTSTHECLDDCKDVADQPVPTRRRRSPPMFHAKTKRTDFFIGDTGGPNHFEHGTPNLSPIGGYK